MSPECYTVITADVIKSRRIEARGAEQERIIRYLEELNEKFGSWLAAGFVLSAGDQIQAVVGRPDRAPEVLRFLRGGLLPLRLRCGIGFGEITTAVHPSNPGWMDGPAFHRARAGLDEIKDDPYRMTCWRGFGALDDWLDGLYGLLDAVQSKWTPRQWAAIIAYIRVGRYELAGRNLGISGPGVYKQCRAAHWEAFRRGEELAVRWLNERIPFLSA